MPPTNQGFLFLTIQCPCGGQVIQDFRVIIITHRRMLCFTGICPDCRGIIATKKSLEELLEESKSIPPPNELFTDADRDILKHDFHILPNGEGKEER